MPRFIPWLASCLNRLQVLLSSVLGWSGLPQCWIGASLPCVWPLRICSIAMLHRLVGKLVWLLALLKLALDPPWQKQPRSFLIGMSIICMVVGMLIVGAAKIQGRQNAQGDSFYVLNAKAGSTAACLNFYVLNVRVGLADLGWNFTFLT
ncbi:hypothetical protein [Glutamicibacter creatinolyticus]|uniref:hypothetical protein n=1 Tax=Glutamicibacter creatinolyticus TaxID=162496 RepID=UPI001110E4F8|nr:hypothetical protein [Glutamicibacter creatinolyticus]